MSTPRENHHSSSLSGVLALDKPRGITSMTAVAIVRRLAGGTKTGHAGTLDPLATGVLVIAMGQATKIIDQLMATEKRYETAIDLSAFTSTDDLEGERTEIAIGVQPNEEQLRLVLRQFTGRIMQSPPAFSAVKIDGKRAYKMARQGQMVEAPPRPVVVHSIDLVKFQWPIVELKIHCAKGFYVRSLARDLGRALHTGGHCTAIRRTAVRPFVIENARLLEQLPARITPADLIDVAQAMRMLEQIPDVDRQGGGLNHLGPAGPPARRGGDDVQPD